MKNFSIKVNGCTTATSFELESLLHNFLLEHTYIKSEDKQIHMVMVDEIIVLDYQNDKENDIE